MKLFTSFVSPATFREFIKQNYLPIFIIRNIKTSNIVGHFEDSILHFKEFSPSNELFRLKRDGVITKEEFDKRYINEIREQNLLGLLEKIEYLAGLANTDKVVLLGYGSKVENCHRSTLVRYIQSVGLWEDFIDEI